MDRTLQQGVDWEFTAPQESAGRCFTALAGIVVMMAASATGHRDCYLLLKRKRKLPI